MRKTSVLRACLFSLAALLPLLSACTTISSEYPTDNITINKKPQKAEELTSIQNKLIASADHYLGTTVGPLISDDRSYFLDCSSALLAIYYRAGIDLEKCYTGYEGNGVKRLYSCLRDNKLIYNAKIPQVGDLIFWDNTYDRNKDREFNDYFTHAGMVVAVARDGTITYAHHNYRKGVVYEKMNLKHPHNSKLNAPMRMRGSPPAPNKQSLASELVRVFGRAWMLPESYWR